jgi:hypothetical protein
MGLLSECDKYNYERADGWMNYDSNVIICLNNIINLKLIKQSNQSFMHEIFILV